MCAVDAARPESYGCATRVDRATRHASSQKPIGPAHTTHHLNGDTDDSTAASAGGETPAQCLLVRLHPDSHLLRVRDRGGFRDEGEGGLLRCIPHRGALTARLGHRYRVRLGQPGCCRDHGHVGQRRPVRDADLPLLLGRRHPGDALLGHRDDAVLLRLEGPLGARVHVQALRHHGSPDQRAELRAGAVADRRHQPLPAGQDHQLVAGLAVDRRVDRRGHHRLHLHLGGRFGGSHLQRGAAVLRDRGGVAAADPDRPAPYRRLERANTSDHRARQPSRH